jgi:uncharacterized membrane protein
MESPAGCEQRDERGRAVEPMNRLIGAVLRIGVLAAATLVLLGGIVYLAGHGGPAASYHVFRGEAPEFRHVRMILAGAMRLHGDSLIMAGVLVLIATPLARVALSVAAFARQRDFTYVVLTLIVLAMLAFSLLAGG